MAKYTAAQIEAMGKQGHAFKNSDGSYSYPIGDVADLKNAIHAVGRGNADHDAIRKYIAGRAKDLNQMDLIPDNWNADGSLNDANAAAYPFEVRSEVRSALQNVRETRLCPMEFELRDVPNGVGGIDLLFTGYASVTNRAYEMQDFLGGFNEEVTAGAFNKTLKEGCDTAFLLNHEGMTLARTKSGTLKLAEHTVGDPTGLHSEARLDPTNPTVAAMRSAVERGDLDEMSFAFRVTRQKWAWAEDSGADMDHRYIQEVSLNQGDVSLVNYGANPHTGGLVAIRAKQADATARFLELHATALGELRAGKTISAATLDQLSTVATHIGDSDTAAARQVLQQLIDSAQTGAGGNSETQAAAPSLELLARAELERSLSLEADRKSRRAA